MAVDATTDEIMQVGRSAGLDRVGVCDSSVLYRARAELLRRKASGLSDTMEFTFRNPERSTDPSRTMAEARSIIVGARSYHRNPGPDRPVVNDNDRPMGRIAKYAQADFYSALRTSLNIVADHLRSQGHRAVVVADENNLVDREVAWRAGLGWFGKNANLLLPGAGSWFVLGSVITSAELTPSAEPIPDGCGSCRRCVDACPTGAIVADGVIDAGRCLAWLVQKAGVFPFEYRVALDDRMYGCDDCQDSCPVSVRLGPRLSSTVGGELETDAHPGSFDARNVDIFHILDATDTELIETFGRWYIPERNVNWLRRNALIILGNVASVPVTLRTERILERYLHSSDPYVRAQSVWTAFRLNRDDLAMSLADDPDARVRREIERRTEVERRIERDIDTVRAHG